MNRSRIVIALLSAGALLLSACGSDSGDAAPSSAVNGQQSSAAAPASNANPETTPETSAASEATPQEPSSADGSDSEVPSTTVTIGGAMDEQSSAWFGSLCSGLTPVVANLFTLMTAGLGAGADPQAAKQKLVDGLGSMADGLENLGKQLADQAPPTIDRGSDLAAAIQTQITQSVPKIRQVASTLDGASISSADDLNNAMTSVSDSMTDAMDGLSISGFELDDATQAALATVPSCAPLVSMGAPDLPTSN